MEHYVTLFDSLFVPQGLALHASMERHVRNYTLWILCVDDATYKLLEELSLRSVRLLRASELETEELLRTKPTRTKGEYCWTLTPFAPRFVFESDPAIVRVTYIDADLWFRKDPGAIFREFEASRRAVLITDHAYAPEYDKSALSGQFCVQFMTFTRHDSEPIRKWWEERCIEWCYARYENGRFGDQKYLDDWPERFPAQVHVLEREVLALAPWNVSRFPYGQAVFFHFHGLRILSKSRVEIGAYYLPKLVIKHVYRPYLQDIREAVALLGSKGVELRPQAKPESYMKFFGRKIWRIISHIARNFVSQLEY